MRVILIALLLIIPLSTNADPQTQSFTREGVEYVLDLPSHSWRAVSRVDVHEHLEFVNSDDYSNGYLRLRKKLVTPDRTSEDLFRETEQWELQKLPGYVVCSGGKGTEFSGQLKGTVFSYEFVNQGRNMDGRIYFLAWTTVPSTSSTLRLPARSSPAYDTRWIRLLGVSA